MIIASFTVCKVINNDSIMPHFFHNLLQDQIKMNY